MFNEVKRRLVLNYNSGQFTFNNFIPLADDQQLYDLAQGLNRFQETPVVRIVKVQTFELN